MGYTAVAVYKSRPSAGPGEPGIFQRYCLKSLAMLWFFLCSATPSQQQNKGKATRANTLACLFCEASNLVGSFDFNFDVRWSVCRGMVGKFPHTHTLAGTLSSSFVLFSVVEVSSQKLAERVLRFFMMAASEVPFHLGLLLVRALSGQNFEARSPLSDEQEGCP